MIRYNKAVDLNVTLVSTAIMLVHPYKLRNTSITFIGNIAIF